MTAASISPAGKVLPELVSQSVEAAAPRMYVQMIAGRFGKSRIVPDAKAGAEENQRRLGHLQDCVDYVRWHARRLAGQPVLAITHKAVEEHFAIAPNVTIGHFNAMAGLDMFGDVAAIFIIGRPLPSDMALRDPVAALFDVDVHGGYQQATAGIRMRDGSTRSVKVTRHTDQNAELIRAAICDDELIQCIGRGRGVNRTEADPLEVHILADVALPLVHDSLVPWESVRPNVVQQMLMAGVAVSSPADAVALHPDLFKNESQAKKAFERAAFKGQIPMYIYRGMSLKSAQYKRAGRGRGWQTAWWPKSEDEQAVRERIASELGAIEGWRDLDEC